MLVASGLVVSKGSVYLDIPIHPQTYLFETYIPKSSENMSCTVFYIQYVVIVILSFFFFYQQQAQLKSEMYN